MKKLQLYIATTAIAVGLAGTSGLVFAQTPPAAPSATQPVPAGPMKDRMHGRMEGHKRMIDKMFAKLDPKNTGVVTIEAFLAGTDARFDKIDTKKQGFIDKDELLAFLGTSQKDEVDRMMKRLDTDNDGKITKAEFEKPIRKRFALLDLNDDGKITRDEAALAMPVGGPHRDGKWNHRPHHMMNQDQPTKAQ